MMLINRDFYTMLISQWITIVIHTSSHKALDKFQFVRLTPKKLACLLRGYLSNLKFIVAAYDLLHTRFYKLKILLVDGSWQLKVVIIAIFYRRTYSYMHRSFR